jgi:hypothetical protein
LSHSIARDCGAFVGAVVVNLTLGLLAVQCVAYSVLGSGLSWGLALLSAFFLGQFAIPVAILCLILREAGVAVPFWHHGG